MGTRILRETHSSSHDRNVLNKHLMATIQTRRMGARIRDLRESRDMSQGDLARKLRLRAHSQISRIEDGTLEPKLSRLRKIAAVLGVDLSTLLAG